MDLVEGGGLGRDSIPRGQRDRFRTVPNGSVTTGADRIHPPLSAQNKL